MYNLKKVTYFSNTRDDLIALIPDKMKNCNVLEVGCGTGSTLKKLKALGIAKTIVGIELFPSSDNYYDEMDRFYRDNIEKMTFSSDLYNSFDIIILGDVLEHLVDPWSVLSNIAQLLKINGYILLSIPNIQYYETLITILKGDFKYEEAGILDRTHLRFFCKKNITEMIRDANLEIETITSSFDFETTKGKRYWLNRITLGKLHDFFVYQFLIVARKKS